MNISFERKSYLQVFIPNLNQSSFHNLNALYFFLFFQLVPSALSQVLESNVNQMMDDVKSFNEELLEVQRLDALISALRDYSGPTICHEWPYPLIFKGTVDDADVAQILNGRMKVDKTNNNNINERNINCEVRRKSTMQTSRNHQLSNEVIQHLIISVIFSNLMVSLRLWLLRYKPNA